MQNQIITEYNDCLEIVKHHIDQLNNIIRSSGEHMEGNSFYLDGTVGNMADTFKTKRYNLFHYSKNAQNILEIGFNGGHSCLLYLCSNLTSKIDLFDLGCHNYAKMCYTYLDKEFPSRLNIVWGDSAKTLTAFKTNTVYDLLHIDGGHDPYTLIKDINNCNCFVNEKSILIIDDISFHSKHMLPDLTNVVIEQLMDEKLVQIVPPFFCNTHIITKYNLELKLRVAICLSGFIRTWRHTKRTFLEQICNNPNYIIDVFMHTYKQNLYEFTAKKQDETLSAQEFDELFEDINVKSMVIEDRDEILPIILEESKRFANVSNFHFLQEESSDTNTIKIPIGSRTYDHLRKIHLCNELRKEYEKEHGFKYDLVVKSRFDIVYFNSIPWEKYVDNKLHFGYGATWGWPEDTFCVTTPELMDTHYANRFLYLDEIFGGENKAKFGFCSHSTLKYMIDKDQVPIGDAAVNILCFRSNNSLQYGGDYRYRCELDWLYDTLTSFNLNDVKAIEAKKTELLKF